jgi:multidrug efflux pump subunit AcrA (membrane-fusion protein)
VDKTFVGTIWQIGAVIDVTTRQGTVRLAMQTSDRNLRPGAFARADIEVGSSIGVLLPQTAVQSDEHGKYVLVVGRDNKLERRAVTVAGARSEGLLVSQGLEGSERVVAIAGAFLRTGETVAVAARAS